MRLYLMRHGVAESRRPDLDESARALTDKGHSKLAAQVRALKRLDWRADVLLTSPFVRAAETAQYVADVYDRPADPVGGLASGADVDVYFAVLAVQPPEAHVWIVSHEPDLSDVIRALTGGNVKMRKGTIAVLDLDVPAHGGAILLGLYDPDEMGRVAPSPARAARPKPKAEAPGEATSPAAEKKTARRTDKNTPLLDMPATRGMRRPRSR